MSCYTTMDKRELMQRIIELGVNPYNMTRKQMVQFLEGAEIAREMTDEELLAHIKNRC